MTSAWDRAWDAAHALPGRGAKAVRVTRVKAAEYTAVATSLITSGEGSIEVRAAIGPDPEAALEALILRCRTP